MKYRIVITNTRIPFLVSNNVTLTVIENWGERSLIEIELQSGFDALCLFHAGIDCGFNLYQFTKTKS